MLQTRLLGASLLITLALGSFVTALDNAEQAGNKPELAAKEPKKSVPPTTSIAQKQSQQNATISARNSQPPTRARAGRMLDLDHLAGDIGKDEKVARERQTSGDRQSRNLADDLFLVPTQSTTLPKKAPKSLGSTGKKPKKMSISGFIPIVSLEQATSGKLLGDQHEADSDEEEAQEEQQQPPQTNLFSNYGTHTSMGHASFVPQPSQPLPQLLEAGNIDRSGRRAPPPENPAYSLLQGSPIPLRPPPMVHRPQLGNPFPLAQADQHHLGQQQQQECICVSIFQCRNGYISESQLSRGQASQLIPNQQHHHLAQSPRALGASTTQSDLYNSILQANLQQQLAAGLPQTGVADPQQALNNEFIYEQLKKTIESENLEQAAANQPLGDERSTGGVAGKPAGLQQNGTSEPDVLGRNILNPLGLRRPQRTCGFMQTCCRLPTGQQLLHAIPPAQPIPLPSNFQSLRPNRNQQTRPLQPILQPMASQSMQPALVRRQPPMTSTLVDQQLNHLGSALEQVAPTSAGAQYPPGSFMRGRCGLRPTLGISGRVQNQQGAATGESSADFGEFPSHAAILKRLPSGSGDSLFICSAVLVSNQWLVTAAHCVRRLQIDELKVRLGEWDVSRDDEFYPFLESNLRKIIVHPEFQASSLINDIAMMRLQSPLDPQQMPHITPACLATPEEVFDGQRCWLTGWGKDAFGSSGTFQSVLKKVDLPVVARRQCEQALRHQTKLGPYFRLHQSAVCAGGERGKDACEGDGGSGLYCTEPQSGLVKVAGLVSWGVGCGLVGVPGVYTNLAKFYHWIEQVAASSGEESLYMDRNAAAQSIGVSADAFKNIISERSNSGAMSALNGTETSASINNNNNNKQQQQQPATNSNNNATLTAIPTATIEEIEARTG